MYYRETLGHLYANTNDIEKRPDLMKCAEECIRSVYALSLQVGDENRSIQPLENFLAEIVVGRGGTITHYPQINDVISCENRSKEDENGLKNLDGSENFVDISYPENATWFDFAAALAKVACCPC